MKKIYLSLFAILLAINIADAQQWTTASNGNDIYNNNIGTVYVGGVIASSVTPKFEVVQTSILGSSPKNSVLLSTTAGLGNTNFFQNNIWLVRNSTGSDWLSTRLHDGISVDVSFTNPQVDTRTWWERDPNQDIQSWGTAGNTYFMVTPGNIAVLLNPGYLPNLNEARITALGTSGPTGAQNWSIRGVYQYPYGVGLNAAGGDLDLIKSQDGNTVLATKTDGTALGNVLIGKTSQLNSGYLLDVNGNVRANQIVVNTTGADFVFQPSYHLTPLSTLSKYIGQKHHLPEIPSARQMQVNGLNVGDNQVKLLQKVEELTLYLIDKEKEINELKQKQAETNKSQQDQIDRLRQQVEALVNLSAKNNKP